MDYLGNQMELFLQLLPKTVYSVLLILVQTLLLLPLEKLMRDLKLLELLGLETKRESLVLVSVNLVIVSTLFGTREI